MRWNDSVRVDTVLPIRCLFTFLEWLKREREIKSATGKYLECSV